MTTTIDWHTHTGSWSDGRGTVADVHRQGERHGVLVGITDHALRDNTRLSTPAQLDAYLAHLSEYPVLRGVELSIGDLGYQGDGDLFEHFDYVIASLHAIEVDGHRVNATRYLSTRAGTWDGYSLPQVDRSRYFDYVLGGLTASIARWPQVRILGHFALLPEHSRALHQREPNTNLDPEPDALALAYVDELLGICARNGVAIELNAKSRVPQPWIVERALAQGCLFAHGSDAHKPAHVGALAYGQAMCARFGIPANRLLTPAVVREQWCTGVV